MHTLEPPKRKGIEIDVNFFELKNLKMYIVSAIVFVCTLLALSFFMMFLMVQGRHVKREKGSVNEKNAAIQVKAGEKDSEQVFGFIFTTPDRTKDNVVDQSVGEKISECNDQELYCEILVQNDVMGKYQIVSAPLAISLFEHDYAIARENDINVKVTFEKDNEHFYTTDSESINTIRDIRDVDDGAYLIHKSDDENSTKYRYIYTQYYESANAVSQN